MHCFNCFMQFIFLGFIIVTTCYASPRSEKLLKQVRSIKPRSTGVNNLEAMFTQCCALGMSWVDEKRPCEVAVSPPVSGIPVDLQTPCLVTASICCLRSSRNTMCELGKVDAMDGNECLRSVLPGGEYRKDCCDSCKIGLMTGSRGESCSFSTFGFEYPWDEGFADCCQISKVSSGGISLPDVNENNNEVQDGRCGANNPCEHLCKDTGISIECSCQTGYQLEKDLKSCVDINECSSNFHLCDPDLQQCLNTEGSYFCLNEDGSRDYPRTRALESGKTTFSPSHVPRPHGSSGGSNIGSECPIGYNYNSETRTCDDVNECKLNIHACDLQTHNCQNTIGSYLCIEQPDPNCAPGYKYNRSVRSCFDINECAEGLDYCNRDREFCLNTKGGYECQPKRRSQCPAGYKYNSQLLSCEDVNECAENLHNCDTDKEQCRNSIGGYECDLRCEKGFQYNSSLRTCLDVNECEENIHDCKPTEHCINTHGTYHCFSEQCPAGYKRGLDGGCEDVNECLENLDACDKLTDICVNEIGSYKCDVKSTSTPQCATGYRFDVRQNECADVDECSESLHDCDLKQFICVNTQGGFRCQILPCPSGHRLNRFVKNCEDIDECLEGTHNCPLHISECVNTVGGFECQQIVVASCLPGYRFNPTLQLCEDVNECIENSHTCDLITHVCVNTQGSFRCQTIECPSGFRPNIESRSCEDINECVVGGHNCTAIEECVNTMGGFNCKPTEPTACATGHRYNLETRQCEDINECVEGTHTCDTEKEVCLNNAGSFVCRALVCPPGYRPNILARTCVDINECEEKNHNCSVNQECINRFGGFYCQTIIVRDCPLGYKFDLTSKSCKDIDECLERLDNCPSTHYCVNIAGNFVCHAICQQGFVNDPNDPRQCKDIDECADGIDACNRITETCANTVGSYKCVSHQPDCTDGYHYDPNARTCVDIDECAESRHNCPSNQVCINTAGAFHCVSDGVQTCSEGYRFNPSTESCVDIDECDENLYSCDPSTEQCANRDGGYYCVPTGRKLSPPCSEGYHYNPRSESCVDVDECLERLHNCNPHTQNCVNIEGSFVCKDKIKRNSRHNNNNNKRKCSPGYKFDKSSNVCVDVNECQTSAHSCTPSQRCDNTIGSYTCVRTTGCGTGYTLNAQTGHCEDDDECELGFHNCGLLHNCHNILGSFRCVAKVCPSGFQLDSTGRCLPIVCNAGYEINSNGKCVDINECTQANICPLNHACINSIGSYTCEKRNFCGDGFELVGTRCIDIDECVRGTDSCRVGQACVNRQGGYACQCPQGYLMNTNRDCEDIDECTRYGQVCTENGVCQNTPGSYICQCKSGFKQSTDGKTCIDVDECEQTFVCHQKCINTWGSYQCACNQGYTLADDSRTCQDIDECSLWRGRGHLCIGVCVNEPGSYSCNCPDGYKLGADKRTCHDINECSQPNICRQANEVCLNTRGGYRCNEIVCPPNYVRDSEHKTSGDDADDFSVTCHKQCTSDNIICMLNNTNSITHQFTSRPSFPTLSEPLSIVHMKAIIKDNIQRDFHVDIQFEAGKFNHLFDIISDKEQGSLRLISPVIGPLRIELLIVMKLIVHSNIIASKHLIFVHLDIAKHRF